MNIIYENILDNGSIIASPTKDPDYNFHWVRDSAIVINSLIENCDDNQEKDKHIKIFENYINIELIHINHHAAEPKFNIDGTPYLGEWGRPQNDGPALRGIVCLKLINIIPFRLNSLLDIINNDIDYTINNIDKPCFDLWEELYGYHLYTRIMQYAFLYKIKNNNKFKFNTINNNILNSSYKNITDHFSKTNDKIYSAYSCNGRILREYDASLLLAFSFLQYDIPNISIYTDRIQTYVNNMILEFNTIYPINKKLNIPFLGRYLNDNYFSGNPWLITTIALFNYLYVLNKIEEYEEEFENFIKFIKSKHLILPEQIDKNNGNNVSVEKLTWNYAELNLFTNKNLFSLF